MADSTLSSGKALIDLRDTSGSTPADLGMRWRNGAKSYMAVSTSASVSGFAAVKFVGTTGYIVTPTGATTDVVIGVNPNSTSIAANVTTVIQTAGVATMIVASSGATRAADIAVVPLATAGAVGLSNAATTNQPQNICGVNLASINSTSDDVTTKVFLFGPGM